MFEHLSTEASQVLNKLYTIEQQSVEFTVPKEREHGDLTTNIALRISKSVGKSPKDIAQSLGRALSNSPSIEKVEVAGSGYVNLWLTPAALLKELEVTTHACSPQPIRKKDDPIIVEYSQPNIAKPL